MWTSADTLQSASSWLLVVAVVAGVVAAIAGALGTVASNRANDILKRESDERIAVAHENAAKANREAEDLKLKLEQERVERLRLEEKVQPRKISAEQTEIIQKALEMSPRGTVYIQPDWVDTEARMFAAQVADVLRPLGFGPLERLQNDHAPLSYGKLGAMLIVKNAERQPMHFRFLYSAFKRAGIVFDLHAEAYVPDEDSVMIGISSH